ncbi:unnamed protein product [Sphenostylis stenocarpa]|uniref:Uncharacterized protein n=1 Tax=Sphenostylis stenocarpa TaxID=92480 RepID=A0AA86VK88_9FABA|nr:unnamed protein product [Sphenostylis stenocarpa]
MAKVKNEKEVHEKGHAPTPPPPLEEKSCMSDCQVHLFPEPPRTRKGIRDKGNTSLSSSSDTDHPVMESFGTLLYLYEAHFESQCVFSLREHDRITVPPGEPTQMENNKYIQT